MGNSMWGTSLKVISDCLSGEPFQFPECFQGPAGSPPISCLKYRILAISDLTVDQEKIIKDFTIDQGVFHLHAHFQFTALLAPLQLALFLDKFLKTFLRAEDKIAK